MKNNVATAATGQDHAQLPAVMLFAGSDDRAAVDMLEAAYRRIETISPGAEPASISVIGIGEGTEAALARVLATPRQVGRLILIAPVLTEAAPLAAIETPTLVIIGTDDIAGAPDGRRCSEEMPSCYLMLVYDAGRDVAAARPEVTAALIEQFLETGETFPVTTASQMLFP